MQDFNIVSGRIIEIRRYVTPLGLYGQDARRERWELWIKTANGAEEKLIVESRTMQARRGHRVVLALEAGAPVGMVNLTTRTRLNFARSDPPFLYRPLDIAVPVGLMFASLFAATTFGPGLLLVTAPIVVLYVPLLMTARWLSRRSTQRRVEGMLDHMERDAALPAGRGRS
ncbi:MAG: hypothetical protein WA210_02560 [Burkholderiaceae bacterium]